MAKDKQAVEPALRCVWGLLLLMLSLFITLSLFSYDWRDIGLLHSPPRTPPNNLIGPVGAWLSFILFVLWGAGAYVIPVWCVLFGAILLINRQPRLSLKALWSALLVLTGIALLELHQVWGNTVCQRLNIPDSGGLFGYTITQGVLIRWLSPVGAGLVLWGVLLIALLLLIGLRNVGHAFMALGRAVAALIKRLQENRDESNDHTARLEKERRRLEKERRRLEKSLKQKEKETRTAPRKVQPKTPAPPRAAPPPKPKPVRPAPQPVPPAAPPPEPPPKTPETPYVLPPLELLDHPPSGEVVEVNTEEVSRILVETLADFGIEVEATNVEVGPVVTSYELLPAPGVRVERISGLANNLALSLKATSVRVQAPIPGKGVVGIEVPNDRSKAVYLRDVLESKNWNIKKIHLPLVLGQDVGGNVLVGDLAKMPHLLIAGATGAGKTVCMNSVLAGLLMARTPDELKLLLVDPKIVEFSGYNNLPHLVVPVITDPKKVALGLRWAINEMERRYKLFARVGVRNIDSYNTREIAKQEELFDAGTPSSGKDEPPDRVPYIVIVVDELADLMLAAQAEIENCIARLAQLSRAVGIHMILSTQRPSVNVITGTIKANFPARIAFQVAQKVDSRTILDTVGADKLLGRGDMLFLPPGSSKLVRAQGALTSDPEMIRIVEYIKKQGEPSFEVEIKEKLEKASSTSPDMDDGSEDDLLSQAVEIIRETQRASTSSLQRRLRIGYTRAARLMDILEERGVIGPPRGSDPREILIDLDGDIPNNVDQNEPGEGSEGEEAIVSASPDDEEQT